MKIVPSKGDIELLFCTNTEVPNERFGEKLTMTNGHNPYQPPITCHKQNNKNGGAIVRRTEPIDVNTCRRLEAILFPSK
jgi:hypothetical protein